MKIKITQSSNSEHVGGITCPPFDGKCQSCERPNGYWMRSKQGGWICIKCHREEPR